MSAWVCSDDHINLLTSYVVANGIEVHHNGRRHLFARAPQELAAELYAANVRSVNHRYGENEPIDGITYQPYGVEAGAKVHAISARMEEVTPPPNLSGVTPVMVLKLCDCYDYQACERDDYDESLACAAVQAIRKAAISKLPGYDAAPWGI